MLDEPPRVLPRGAYIVLFPLFFKESLIDLSFTNASFALTLNFLIFFLFLAIVGKGNLVPNRWQVVKENFFEVIHTVVENTLGGSTKVKQVYLPIILTMASMILLSNVVSMVPYSFAVTSHLIVTIYLATILFVPITLLAIILHGINSLSFFLPGGCPAPLMPLLVPIEVVTYVFRLVSLSVRLFANIMAGHILLKVLAGFGWTMLNSADFFLVIVHIIPVLVVFALFGLELGVALIQTYVWTMLTCIYINDAIYLH
jgi:ATP synthase subunit 6